MDLSTLRNEIDRIDSQLVQLYEQRMEICSQVAEYKIENGKKVFDKTREEEKLARVRSLTHNDFNSQGVTELFEQIMAMSRKLQYQMLESHGRTSRLPFIPVENLDTKKARLPSSISNNSKAVKDWASRLAIQRERYFSAL